MPPRPATSPLFPYTTLFRSRMVILRDNDMPLAPEMTRYRSQAARYSASADAAVTVRGLKPPVHCCAAPSASDGSDASVMPASRRSEEHTSELQSLRHLVCRL